MTSDGSTLNDAEKQIRDVLKAALGKLGVITKIQQNGDRVAVHVTSQNDFDRAAKILTEAGPAAARKVGCNLDVNLTTSWPT